MTTIKVCVGSACHLKGSYNVINAFQEQINDHNLGEKITLKAIFCLDHCSQAVSVKLDNDDEIHSVSEKTVGEFFDNNVMPRVS
jgi:NADH:ubiquinone oxidoreductase subunit E